MLNLQHGGQVQDAPASPAETPFDYLLPQLDDKPEARLPGAPAAVTAALKTLGAALVDAAPPLASVPDPAGPVVKVNSTIPAVYTYWGQFIDHDMTANTDRDPGVLPDVTVDPVVPVDPAQVKGMLKNLRRPTFDLDSVYGNGPGLDDDCFMPDPGPADTGLYDGIRMRVGRNTDGDGIPGDPIPEFGDPANALRRDLPRVGPLLDENVVTEDDLPDELRGDAGRTRAFIADLRNDENLIVAQFHLAFLRFHNAVADAVEADRARFGVQDAGEAETFEVVRRLVRFHYQWLVVHDYLKTVCQAGIVDKILVGGTKHYRKLPGGVLFAPLEYSVAAFRFGHTMVRNAYDHNRNFGRRVPPGVGFQPVASFADLFRFTGNGHEIDPSDLTRSVRDPFRGLPTLPSNWPIEWDRMIDKGDPNEAHFARKIDTRLVDAMHNMSNEGTGPDLQDPGDTPIRRLLRNLAQRNLLRGYLLSIPTGQAMAAEMQVTPLSGEEIRRGNSDTVNAALDAGGFVENTPLWFYILKEAEVRADGNSLGELGSRIVVETQLGIMKNDPHSYLADGWDPSQGVRLANGDPIVTIRDFFAFARLVP